MSSRLNPGNALPLLSVRWVWVVGQFAVAALYERRFSESAVIDRRYKFIQTDPLPAFDKNLGR